jgi:hypothetical protein
MSYNIEFLGSPGSGKSYIFDKLINDLKKKNIKIKKPKDVIITDYLKTKTDISYTRKLGYYFYFKKIKVDSKYIFNKEYKNFSNYIDNYIKKDLKIKSILNIYIKYLSTTNYSFERKKRMKMNFLIDYFATKINLDKEKINLVEEGFFQKIYLNFFYKNKKIARSLLIKYLNNIPKPNLLLLVETDISICFERTKNRKNGFLYNYENISYLNKKRLFNNYLIDYARKKRIKIIKINNNQFDKKKYKSLILYINNIIKK